MNALINTFIEGKKLYSNIKKCYLIHIGPLKDECCPLKVHDSIMKETTSEKYLGDIVSNTGNCENIAERGKIGRKCISDTCPNVKTCKQGSDG